MLAAALGFAPVGLLAQNTTQAATTNAPAPAPATSPPAGDAIGPRELQNFSLPGTTVRPADQPPARSATSTPPAARTDAPVERTSPRAATRSALRAAPRRPAASPTTVTMQQPSLPPSGTAAPTGSPQASTLLPTAGTTDLPVSSTVAVEPARPMALWPWIAAACALAGAGIFLWLRRRPRQAYAGLPELGEFPIAEPVAPPPPLPRSPVPQAEPPRPARPVSTGIVASRLRPALEVEVHPLRCTLSDSEVAIEFEVELINGGSSPARAVFAEASLFNAGVGQEQDLEAFFAKTNGGADALDRIEPLKNTILSSRVIAPRSAIRQYELAGRPSFVPLIAINARYEWSGGSGQTCAAFLIGRESGAQKLGPLWLDSGSRDLTGLGARALPIGRQS